SIRPGIIRSPPASSLPLGASPSPIASIRPLAKATQPCSTTRSASTILALPMMVSCLVKVISILLFDVFLCRRRERHHIDDTVRNPATNILVMHDCHDRNTRALLFL